mgnify:CR=1 FL=1
MKNYYDILEVNQKASKEVIQKAYKVLVRKYHPDLYRQDQKKYAENKIKEINEAYNVLSDDFLREQYDKELQKEIEQINSQKYSSQTNIYNNYYNTALSGENETNTKKAQKETKQRKIGTLQGIIEVVKELYKNKPKRDEFKEVTKKDILALVLTIIIVILIGIALWFIPFTNGWMRELLFENPLFNWIGSIFS